MNRTDRLLAIVLELEGKRRRRAEDLARTFETSKRTIYRDIQALCEAGVPLVSVPGRGYSLMEGYFLPPLSFSTDEAAMLLLGSEVMTRGFDAEYREAAASAGRKIAAVLPEQLRAEVEALRESILVRFSGPALRPETEATLRRLRRAILMHARVRFEYHARYPSDAPVAGSQGGTTDDVAMGPAATAAATPREADPYTLISLGGVWYLTAYCHLRHDVRHFRLERIEQLEVLERTFTRPAVVPTAPRDLAGGDGFAVRVLFDNGVARWVRESPSYFTVAAEERADGLLVTLRIRREDEVMPWLLGWGRHARVLEPESLRRRVAEEARMLLRQHEDTRVRG